MNGQTHILWRHHSRAVQFTHGKYTVLWLEVDSQIGEFMSQNSTTFPLLPEEAPLPSPLIPSLPSHRQPLIYLVQVSSSGPYTYIESYIVWSFVTAIFPLAECFPGSFVL